MCFGQDLVSIRQKREDGPIEFEPCEEGIADKLRQQFRLTDYDERIEAVYAQLQLDPKMAALVERYYGLRIMKVDPWEVFGVLHLVGPQPLSIARCNLADCQRHGRDR